jgi:hypothetical protein
MTRLHIEFQVEEPSMEATLAIIVPRIVADRASHKILNYKSKYGLLKKLPDRLRAYQRRIATGENLRIVVLLDADDENCVALKRIMEAMAVASGITTKATVRSGQPFVVLNRVVCHELESWFLGEPGALRRAYPRLRSDFGNRRPYGMPDQIRDPWKQLLRLLRKSSYQRQKFSKIDLARRVAPYMTLNDSRSPSFRVFVSGVEEMLQG